MDYLVSRELNTLYILLDVIFLIMISIVLLKLKKKTAFLFGLAGGIIYFMVDYGIFYRLLGTREVIGANPFYFLLWLSMSYGFTNFLWIWLFFDKEKKIVEWSLLIVIGWFSIAMIAQAYGQSFSTIQISRGTSGYHGAMAIMLILGYFYVIIRNLMDEKNERIPILKLLMIGIIVQFSWEFVLLISGIRPMGFQPLIINSLLETNLGIPYLFFIHRGIKRVIESKESFVANDSKGECSNEIIHE